MKRGWLVLGLALSSLYACVGDPSGITSGGGDENDASVAANDGSTTDDDGSVTPPSDGGGGADGSAVVCDPGKTACGTACFDLVNDDANCGACGHSCGGDGCGLSTCTPKVLLSGLTAPTSIATSDATDQFVFNAGGMVRRCAKTGCGGTAIAEWSNTGGTTYATHPESPVAIYKNGTQERVATILYASTATTSALVGTVIVVPSATAPSSPTTTALPGFSIGNVVGDDVSAAGDVALQGDYDVWGCPLGNCATGAVKYAGESGEKDIAIQPGTPGYYAWPSYTNIQYCARGTASSGSCTAKTLYANATTDTDAAVGTPDDNPHGNIAVSATKAFWSATSGTKHAIFSCAFPAGCAHPTLVVDQVAHVDDFVADDSGVYWLDRNGGAVYACLDSTKGCGTAPKVVATDLSLPTAIAMDKKYLFVTAAGVSAGQGKVVRIVR